MVPIRSALVLAVVCATLAACSSRDAREAGAGDTSCAAVIVYDGHTYRGRGGLKRDPATTGRVAAGVIPACDDSGNQDPPGLPQETVQVAELDGVSLETALLWADAIYLRRGRELPASTEVWFRAPRCTTEGEFDLTADWIGVTGRKKPRFDGDVRVPSRLQVHVTEGPEEYLHTTLYVHVDATTQPSLGSRDVKESLWEGGQVAARVRCVDGRFRAVSLSVPPRT